MRRNVKIQDLILTAPKVTIDNGIMLPAVKLQGTKLL